MSASLSGFEQLLLFTIWASSAVMAVVSTSLLLMLAVRRLVRDRKLKSQEESALVFERLITKLLAKDILPVPEMLPPISDRDIEPLIGIMLNFFRNIEGKKSTLLARIVEVWGVEETICNKTKRQRRGLRIQALTVLSYMYTERSLVIITQALQSQDLYVRLAAIRCLARRRALDHLPAVLAAINRDDQHNSVLLADILQRFGPEADWAFEQLAREARNPAVCAAALEALRLVRPERTSLDLKSFLFDPSPAVRAGAVDLIPIASGDRDSMIQKALLDRSALVRARILQVLPKLGGADRIIQVMSLLDDPVWWVRYRAHQALEALGPKGRAYLRALSVSENENAGLANAILIEARSA